LQTLGNNEGENPDLEDSDDDEENTDDSVKEGTSTVTGATPARVAGQLTSNPTESRIAFEIDPNMNINSKALLDMISETDTVSAAARAPATSKPTNQEKKISVAEAFDNW
jgi:hypothetical protein